MLERLRAALGLTTRGVGTSVHTATDYGRDILVNSPDGWEQTDQYMWWFGPGAANGFGNPPPDARNLGVSGASAIPAVMRCTSIIADTIAAMPWRVYRGYDQQATPRWITDPQLTRPDGRVFIDEDGVTTAPRFVRAKSAVEFWAEVITSALWFGDAFIVFDRRDATGQPKAPLFNLNPNCVEWREGAYWVATDDGDVRLDPDLLIHLRGEPPYDGPTGDGIIDRY